MHREAWCAAAHGVTKKSDTTERLTLSLSSGGIIGSLSTMSASEVVARNHLPNVLPFITLK